jgi:hypothetical protein
MIELVQIHFHKTKIFIRQNIFQKLFHRHQTKKYFLCKHKLVNTQKPKNTKMSFEKNMSEICKRDYISLMLSLPLFMPQTISTYCVINNYLTMNTSGKAIAEEEWTTTENLKLMCFMRYWCEESDKMSVSYPFRTWGILSLFTKHKTGFDCYSQFTKSKETEFDGMKYDAGNIDCLTIDECVLLYSVLLKMKRNRMKQIVQRKVGKEKPSDFKHVLLMPTQNYDPNDLSWLKGLEVYALLREEKIQSRLSASLLCDEDLT